MPPPPHYNPQRPHKADTPPPTACAPREQVHTCKPSAQFDTHPRSRPRVGENPQPGPARPSSPRTSAALDLACATPLGPHRMIGLALP